MDASGRAEPPEVKAYKPVLQTIMLLGFAVGVGAADEAQRLESIRQLFEQQKWEEILRRAQGPAAQSADFDYYAGMALSHLKRWAEARDAFSNGLRKAPRDPRFLTERAGTEYRLND
ncbi:MAG TPA: hypothetical protein VK514_05485, partial [Candidatus Acidoferrum sp.]|nr:hypothetical protein [Candidatus Acidoferrum sp.]